MTLHGAWVKLRKPMKKYPKTEQQKNVKVGGELVRRLCKGKKGKDFFACRSMVLKCAFDDSKCDGELLDIKREILEED